MSDMIQILLPDGSGKEIEKGTTAFGLAKGISNRLAKEAMAAVVNGETADLTTVLQEGDQVSILKFEDAGGTDTFRHTSAHILAQAVKRLYPDAKLAIGPAVLNGYYYDFDIEGTFKQADLDKIEAEMKKIVKEDLKVERFELPRAEALELMEEKGESYKVELINELPEDAIISFYQQGEFVDLCAGSHLPSTKPVKALKLTSATGAYWRGDENNKMLQRIYGTSFPKAKLLDEYLEALEEAKKRDHNKLGRELEMFTTADEIGQGLPILLPKGAKIVQTLQRFVEDEEERRGYLLTKTPLMSKSDLFKRSGHWDLYRDGMFIMGDVNEEDGKSAMALRPMTCPFQFMAYKAKQRSYRDLPLRYGETSTLFRNESSGEMHGLIRVRQFTISEGHLIVRPDQLEEEIRGVVDLVDYMMNTLGIQDDVTYQFSKWDPNNREKYIGEPDQWEATQDTMREILDHMELDYVEVEGEAAFYGPKLDIQFKNVFGKEDTIITVQVDFALAERFDMNYIDKDGQKKAPVIIHRTSIGCYERTLAMLIEKYAGAFPTWLAPVQAKVLTISEKYDDYAAKVVAQMQRAGIRVELDNRGEKIGYKIREARNERLQYILIVGEQEEKDGTVATRTRKNGDEGALPLDDVIGRILRETAERSL